MDKRSPALALYRKALYWFHFCETFGDGRWAMEKKVTRARKRKSNTPRSGGEATVGYSPSVEIGASAKLEASAKYEVKKTIHETIPEDVTRAKASTWLTILSPLTEWAGLKGDELAYKRQILRLHREECLLEIVEKAKLKLRSLGANRPMPLKFLVPFLEKASLEDQESDLTELWANLLVSAAEDYDPHYVHFTDIISRLSGLQAKVLVDLLGTDDARALELAIDGLNADFLHNFMQEYIKCVYDEQKNKPKNVNEMDHFLDEALNIIGTEIQYYEVGDNNAEDDWLNGTTSISNYRDGLETDFAILAAMGLIRYMDTGYFDIDGRWRIKVLLYWITSLGREFAKACGIVKDRP